MQAPNPNLLSNTMKILDHDRIKIDQLIAAIIKGEESGGPVPFDVGAFIAAIREVGLPPRPAFGHLLATEETGGGDSH